MNNHTFIISVCLMGEIILDNESFRTEKTYFNKIVEETDNQIIIFSNCNKDQSVMNLL